MFCPKCKAEYREGFTECADCQVPLVNELPSESPEPIPEFVDVEAVLSTKDPGEVALIKSLLEAEDIPFIVQGDHFSSVRNFYPKSITETGSVQDISGEFCARAIHSANKTPQDCC